MFYFWASATKEQPSESCLVDLDKIPTLLPLFRNGISPRSEGVECSDFTAIHPDIVVLVFEVYCILSVSFCYLNHPSDRPVAQNAMNDMNSSYCSLCFDGTKIRVDTFGSIQQNQKTKTDTPHWMAVKIWAPNSFWARRNHIFEKVEQSVGILSRFLKENQSRFAPLL